jgi:phosphate starvation-inducible PhoH-like protein
MAQKRFKERSPKKVNNHNRRIIEEIGFEIRPSSYEKEKVQKLSALNEAQAHYIMSIESNNLTFGIGPAGTGKTYVCGAIAAEALATGNVGQIIITRPAVEAGESLGFLPGELEEKYEPYIEPFRDVLNERLGKSRVDYAVKRGQIKAVPFAYMRGKTFKDAFVILDEAQNTTPTQMKLFLTRIGTNCTVIVNGDIRQKDIRGESGLEDAIKKLTHLKGINLVEFDRADIVRSGLVQQIVEAYEG